MNKIAIIAGGAIAVVAVAVSPLICGLSLESKFDSEIKKAQQSLQFNPDVKLERTEYKRGWSSSTVKTTLDVDGEKLIINHNITHGPFGYFGLGKMESRLELTGELKDVMDKLFAGKDPLLVTTKVSFSGTESIDILSPAIDKQTLTDGSGAVITWGGLNGSFKISGDSLLTDLKAPAFSVVSPEVTINVSNITMTGKNLYIKDWSNAANKNWGGNIELNVEKISVENPMGSGSLSMNLSAISTDEANDNLDYATTLKFTNIDLPPVMNVASGKHDKVELGLIVRGLPKKPLVAFFAKAKELQQTGSTPSDAEFMPLLQNVGINYLQGTPSIAAYGHIVGEKGKISIDTEAKLEPADSSADIMTLLMNAQSRLVITVSPSFSEKVLDELAATGQLPMDKDEFIQAITEANRFTLNNGEYSGKFEYKQGEVYSNGQLDADLLEMSRYMLPSGVL